MLIQIKFLTDLGTIHGWKWIHIVCTIPTDCYLMKVEGEKKIHEDMDYWEVHGELPKGHPLSEVEEFRLVKIIG